MYLDQGGKVRDLCEKQDFSPDNVIKQFKMHKDSFDQVKEDINQNKRFDYNNSIGQSRGWSKVAQMERDIMLQAQTRFRQLMREYDRPKNRSEHRCLILSANQKQKDEDNKYNPDHAENDEFYKNQRFQIQV